MRRIHIIGRKNSGKTTLVVELVRELSTRGLRVGTVKHTHHKHELDTPGKDSFRHREAGAALVGILSPGMDAVFRPHVEESQPRDRYADFEAMFANCDIVLVEGDSQTEAMKVEVWRKAVTESPLAAHDSTIVAVITDDPMELETDRWPRNDVALVASRLLELAMSRPD